MLMARVPPRDRRRARDDLEDAVWTAVSRLIEAPELLTADVRNAEVRVPNWIAGVAWSAYLTERMLRLRTRSTEGLELADGSREREREHGSCQEGGFDDEVTSHHVADDELDTVPLDFVALSAPGCAEPPVPPTPPAAPDPRAERLRAAHLTPAQRDVLDARARDESFAEIARMRGVSEFAARDLVRRAKLRAAGGRRRMSAAAPWLAAAALRAEREGRTIEARILRLRMDGTTIPKIAAALGVTMGTVRGRLAAEWQRECEAQRRARSKAPAGSPRSR
ncbi:MAG: hypothetical protein HMLKMBBP_02244 [Planctomycetes bacterium]|nr:hypothetical protein [Planctomycetota bacterium]